MKVLPLLLVLATAAAAQDERPRRCLDRRDRASRNCQDDTALLRFAPTSGTGLPVAAELCDVAASYLTGASAFCLKSDGTAKAGGLAMAAVGAPTAQTIPTCPNGPDCADTAGRRTDGVDDGYTTSGSPASPAGDFTACWFGSLDGTGGSHHLLGKESSLSARGFEASVSVAGTLAGWVYTNADGSTQCNFASAAGAVVAGANHLICTVYDFVTSGTSTAKVYVDGAQSGSTTSSCTGPMFNNSAEWGVSVRNPTFFPGWAKGRVRGAFVTEAVLSDAQHAGMARAVLADTPTGTRGQALTLTRASSKTCCGSGGCTTIPASRACVARNGLEVEESRTNLVLQSGTKSHAAWTKNNVTVTCTATGPDGVPNACTVTDDATNGQHRVFNASGITVTAAATYTWSTFAKAGTANWIRLHNNAGTLRASFNLATGAVGTTVGSPTTWSQSVGNGWYWVGMTGAANGASEFLTINMGTSDAQTDQSATYVGTGSTVVLAGSQLELGAFPTSSIATAGTSVVRNADVATMQLPASFSQVAGCLGVTTYLYGATATARVLDLNASNPIYVANSTATAGDDTTTGLNVIGLTNIVRRSVRHTFGWVGATMTLTSDGVSDTDVYDGSVISASNTLYLGVRDDTASNWVNGVLSNVVIGTSATGCTQ